jgi:hypothetical protein
LSNLQGMKSHPLNLDADTSSMRWPLTILLIGLFSLGGLCANQPRQKQIITTELVSSSGRIVKRTLSYKQAVSSFQVRSTRFSFLSNQFKLSTSNYSQFIKIKFDEAAEQELIIKIRITSYIQQKIASTSGEDNFQPARG